MAKNTLQYICILGLLLSLGCDDNPPEADLNQFDRPGQMALVCYLGNPNDGIETLPIGCCQLDGPGVEGYCSLPNPEASVAAFVTQSTPGEVAVLDVYSEKVIDQEERIPLNSFIPVGGQPLDITSKFDGSRLYTSNFETADISVIHAAESFGPTMVNSYAINVEEAAAHMVVVERPLPDGTPGTFGFVTQPTVERLAVVGLDDESCPFEDGVTGCLLGWLPLDTSVLDPSITANTVLPFAMVSSETGPLIFVAGLAAPVLFEIDSSRLIDEALAGSAASALDGSAIVRQIYLNDRHISVMSLEPVLERWIYAADLETGGVVVVNLLSGELEIISGDDPYSEDPYVLELTGKVQALSMLRLTDSGDPDPYTFNGSFAAVACSDARMYMIDVQDMDNPFNEAHKVRSAVELFNVLEVSPRLENEPVLTVEGQALAQAQAEEFVLFVPRTDLDKPCIEYGVEPDTSTDADTDEPYYHPDADQYGFHFACDPRNSSNEDWQLNWQGSLGVTGAVVIEYSSFDESVGEFTVRDMNKDFEYEGVLARVPGVGPCESDPFEIPPSYTGDWIEITTTIEADGREDCTQFEDRRLFYQVVDIVDGNGLVLSNRNFDVQSPLPIEGCFGAAVNYEIRAVGHWVLEGLESGYKYLGCPQRVWANGQIPFRNKHFSVLLETPDEVPYVPMQMFYNWRTVKGFEPLYSYLGSNGNRVTELVMSPTRDLILVDQASDRLVVFDLFGEFAIISTPPQE